MFLIHVPSVRGLHAVPVLEAFTGLHGLLSAVPVATMEDSVLSLHDTLFVVYALVALVWAMFRILFLSGRFDLGSLALAGLATAVANALYAVRRLCEGAMGGVLHLGAPV